MRPRQCLLFLLVLATAAASGGKVYSSHEHSHTPPSHYETVLVSTLDGRLRALDTLTGEHKWDLNEDPVLRAPSHVKQGFTFLPNPQDGSLYVLKEGELRKLPFSIPQLVHNSPCRGSDGILYAGSKKDVWFGIDPVTGEKVETLSSASAHRVCPAATRDSETVFVGRTEYRVSMFDPKEREKAWNATFADYSAHLLPADNHYPLEYYASSSTGHVLAVDRATGQVLWERDVGAPIAAMYLLQADGLHRLGYTVMGKETMRSLVEDAFSSPTHHHSSSTAAQSLFPTLYVGESAFGLYAIAAFVDQHTITYGPKFLGPPLLEGPMAIAVVSDPQPASPPVKRPIVRIDHPTITHKTQDGEYLLLGYHEPPPMHQTQLIPSKIPSYPVLPTISFEDRRRIGAEDRPRLPGPKEEETPLLLQLYYKYPWHCYAGAFTLLAMIGSIVWMCGRQTGIAIATGSAQTSRHSLGGRVWTYTKVDEVPDGWLNIGKLHYNPGEVLGRGCEGTVVYRGRFDGREVAVKRVVSEFVRLADREVDLLRQSDTHNNVIRYFCMEADSQFRYLALELCVASLHDYVTEATVRQKIQLQPLDILQQATEGIAHLHAINIVHRDMKPQNVLLSMADQRGRVRALISDFGLCKRIQAGKQSLSRRSGLAGTDGWIAPEALFGQSTTFSVDVFSLGCIFHYVLSEGSHPFGDSLHRQANIIDNVFDLKKMKTHADCGVPLVCGMLAREPSARPSAAAVLAHPFFWNNERRLQFFGDVSDRVEKEEECCEVVRRLESNAKAVVCGNWRNQICQPLAEDLRKFRTYKGHSVRDLLRAMRNKKHHYRELPDAVRESLGHIPEQFVSYFITRFPLLLLHAYDSMEWCADEPVFRGYYPEEARVRWAGAAEAERREREAKKEEVNDVWQRGQEAQKKEEAVKRKEEEKVAKEVWQRGQAAMKK